MQQRLPTSCRWAHARWRHSHSHLGSGGRALSEGVRANERRRGSVLAMAAAAAEQLRISQVGLAARSPEGHAAKGGMAIKGNEDMWVTIQANTFRNWVNEHLKTVSMAVRDLATDFCDGTKLVALIEVLQKRPLRHIKRPANPHQYLENVTAALNAVAEDGVKLVNIGRSSFYPFIVFGG